MSLSVEPVTAVKIRSSSMCLAVLLTVIAFVAALDVTFGEGSYFQRIAALEGSATRYNYSNARSLSILLYDAQRSGKLPANQPIPWRGDSALHDSDNGHDLSGGWYEDTSYAVHLLQAVISLYEFAVDHQGVYSKSVPQSTGFYIYLVTGMRAYKLYGREKHLNECHSEGKQCCLQKKKKKL